MKKAALFGQGLPEEVGVFVLVDAAILQKHVAAISFARIPPLVGGQGVSGLQRGEGLPGSQIIRPPQLRRSVLDRAKQHFKLIRADERSSAFRESGPKGAARGFEPRSRILGGIRSPDRLKLSEIVRAGGPSRSIDSSAAQTGSRSRETRPPPTIVTRMSRRARPL